MRQDGGMETRRLGRLGHLSSVLIYGGAALAEVSQDEADRSIGAALEAGINHFDTAADYGESELRLGAWMPRIRDRIFLATKTGDREAGQAYDSLRRSLDRLQTDRVDLIQLHAVGNLDELDSVTRSGGALEGVVRARDEGLTRGIGITGHGPGVAAIHLEACRRFPFDTVLTPYNFVLAREARFRRDFDALIELATAEDIGVMVIKSIARNNWRTEGPRPYDTWYEPLDEQAPIDAAVSFALGRREITGLATAGDTRLLPLMVEAERRREAGETRGSDLIDLGAVSDAGSLFEHSPGRDVPDWMEHLLPPSERPD
jgi:aryl-alcohol dehydrogenase-like predicted oxidoreductase